MIWSLISVRSDRQFWTTSPPKLVVQFQIRAPFWKGNLLGYQLEKRAEVMDCILVSQFSENYGSCNWSLTIESTILNTISSKATYPIRNLKAVSSRVLSWLSTSRTLRMIGIDFGLSISQKRWFVHWDLIRMNGTKIQKSTWDFSKFKSQLKRVYRYLFSLKIWAHNSFWGPRTSQINIRPRMNKNQLRTRISMISAQNRSFFFVEGTRDVFYPPHRSWRLTTSKNIIFIPFP